MTVLCFGLLTMVATRGQKSEYVTVQRVLKLMGSRFEITVVSPSEEIGYMNRRFLDAGRGYLLMGFGFGDDAYQQKCRYTPRKGEL